MSLYSRRSFLVLPLALAACGFSPVYGTGGTGSQLRGQVLVHALQRLGHNDLRQLPAQAQPAAMRPAYLWLHPVLRAPMMRKMAGRRPSHESGRVHAIAVGLT